jgi:hypothetical protein
MVAAIAHRKDRLDQPSVRSRIQAAPRPIEADFTARLRVATAVQEAVDRFGRLDMLARVSFPAATRIFWASHLQLSSGIKQAANSRGLCRCWGGNGARNRPDFVVVPLPSRQHLPRLTHRAEQRPVQAFIAQLAVEAFHESDLLRLARRDVVPADDTVLRPSQHRAARRIVTPGRNLHGGGVPDPRGARRERLALLAGAHKYAPVVEAWLRVRANTNEAKAEARHDFWKTRRNTLPPWPPPGQSKTKLRARRDHDSGTPYRRMEAGRTKRGRYTG